MLVHTPQGEIGSQLVEFKLTDVISGQAFTANELKGKRGLVIAFICNHCPYVHKIIANLVHDFELLKDLGYGVATIMANDYTQYQDDRPELMQEFAKTHNFSFPYLLDETQATATTLGAVCTPDIYGYDRDLKLCYRGRLDNHGMNQDHDSAREPELFNAMKDVITHGSTLSTQYPSMGCSIKWRIGLSSKAPF